MTTILYTRTSTVEQTIDHQLTQAKQAGFVIDEVIADEGQSGVKLTLKQRPEGRRLYDRLRRGDVLVIRWVDRLGRSYPDVTEVIRHFMDRGIIIRTVINNLTFDGATSDPMQMAVRDALIGFMAATAQAQAEATKAAQRAGIDHVKAKADAGVKYRGRKPSYNRDKLRQVQDMLSQGAGPAAIAKATGLTLQTVLRIRDTPEKAEAALAAWQL